MVDLEEIKKEIGKVREKGFVLDQEEYGEGPMCVGAPIKNFENHIIAALAVAGPTSRMLNNEDKLIEHVLNCAKKISMAFGHIENGII